MLTPPDLRWRERRSVWMPQHQLFHPREFGVDVLPDDSTPRAFVKQHHYSGSYPAARLRVGLYRKIGCLRSYLAGVAVFSVCVQPRAYQLHLGTSAGIELGRLVLLDEVGFNGESWFMARAFSALKRELPEVKGVLSYSDPLPRWNAAGGVVTPGHVGQVYQALNASYVGRSKPRTLHLDPAGRTISERAICKIRAQERGWEPAYRRLVDAGAPERVSGEEPAAWITRVLPMFRRVSHPGNHAYAWRWDAKIPSRPYPRRPGI